MPRLVDGVNLKDLMEGGATFSVNLDDNKPEDENANEEGKEIRKAMLEFSNLDLLGYENEETYNEGDPFDLIEKKMFNLYGDKVKKFVIRKGYGEVPPEMALVRVHYNAYIEFEPSPFDSTYARKKPHTFRISSGEVIPGLDVAVQSMKLNEKSQFLISPDFAYGPLGCLGRVPANTTVLFEVELIEIIDSGAASKYDELSEEKKKEFSEIHKYCLALCVKGKELIKTMKNYRSAIREYNVAVSKLENCVLSDFCEQENQQALLLKLYSNLLICYTIVEEPKRGCSNANKIFNLTKGTTLKVPVKVYFNHAKCLRMLGNYSQAKQFLRQAHKLEPKNPEIAQEYLNLEEDMKVSKENERKMGKALTGNK